MCFVSDLPIRQGKLPALRVSVANDVPWILEVQFFFCIASARAHGGAPVGSQR